MQKTQLKPSIVVAPKASFSPQGQAPFEPQQSNIKKSLSIGLLALTLLSGAGYLINKQLDQEAVKKAQITKQYKAEFVKGVLALSDDGYQNMDKFKKDDPYKHSDHHIHDTADSLPEAAPIMDGQQINVVENAEFSSSFLPEDDERARAIESETLSRNVSEGIETHHQAERNILLQKKAEVAARDRVAREDAMKRRDALRPRAPASKSQNLLQPSMAIKIPYLLPQNPQLEAFRGALTKCHIKGHDVHWINNQGWILEHLKVNSIQKPNVLIAREIIKETPGVVVVVYEKGYEAYDSLGNLVATGNKE